MTVESQHGAALYRLHADNPQVIEWQPRPRLRWRVHSRYPTADLAQRALWRLARGKTSAKQGNSHER